MGKSLPIRATWGKKRATHLAPKFPRWTHCWSRFVRVKDQGEGRPPKIESHTISWVPANLKVQPWKFHVQKGTNLSLQETLLFAMGNRERISEWGPYECRPRLYYRALVQKEFLESGRVGYQCIDDVGEAARTGDGCDCIHAMTDMDPLYSRARYPLTRFGDAATRFVARELRRRDILIRSEQTHDWLNASLGLEPYPILHRQYLGW